jgi:hypothetical protein
MNKQILKINLGASRESQRQQGYFDAIFLELNEIAMTEKAENYNEHNNNNYRRDDTRNVLDADSLPYK